MPLAIAHQLGERVQSQLEAEQTAHETKAQNKALSRKRSSLAAKLEAAFDRNRISSIKARGDILTIVAECLRDVPSPTTASIHGLSSDAAEQVRTQLVRASTEASSEMKQVASELDKLNRQLHKLEKDIARAPSQAELTLSSRSLEHCIRA